MISALQVYVQPSREVKSGILDPEAPVEFSLLLDIQSGRHEGAVIVSLSGS